MQAERAVLDGKPVSPEGGTEVKASPEGGTEVKASPEGGTELNVITQTTAWLEHAVIGLNFCPFAKAVHVKGKIRWIVSAAKGVDCLLNALRAALIELTSTPITDVETTLLIHPWVLTDFVQYNNFLALADDLLTELALDGVLQIASFHPNYCFADAQPDDLSNATNQSPYPLLHILREESVSAAVQIYPDSNSIVARNQHTLATLGAAKWATLAKRFTK
jgi:uncharacterized protein